MVKERTFTGQDIMPDEGEETGTGWLVQGRGGEHNERMCRDSERQCTVFIFNYPNFVRKMYTTTTTKFPTI